ncbi:hypothetical protein BDN72DRAFT_963882 [Pluteus cervinus]|uniref:Uncharacterized protein n=1 Tax=Pluteus cervinus TaxID=181527 RepID=A0ACD3AD99_9AGAR|nr:hypothetical protein BDN72DRAFT_963882 [Pluteus cervinus]
MMHQTLTSIPEAHEIAIQKLDDEIRSLTEKLCHLKSQRNGFSITHSLPIEILTEIFVLTQAARYTLPETPVLPASILRMWLPVTHVSRHWRKVALNCSELWREIGPLPEAAIREFLVRSGGRSLSVDVIGGFSLLYRRPRCYSDGLLADIFAQTFRIQRFSLDGAEHFNQVLPYLTSKSAPKLETLSISGGRDAGEILTIPGDVDLFQGTTPQLDTLWLYRCQITPESALFTNNLATLHVNKCPIGSTAIWLRILKQIPRLSDLSLIGSFTDESEYAVESAPTPVLKEFEAVPLLQLSKLAIEGSWLKSDLDFLAHITFPSRATIEFSSNICSPLPQPTPQAPPLISFLRVYNQSRYGPLETEITAITLKEIKEPSYSTSLRFLTEGASRSGLDVTIGGLQDVDCDEALVAEFSFLPISHTTSLTISCYVSPETLKVLSDRLPKLQEVSCSGIAGRCFLMVLTASFFDFHTLEEDADIGGSGSIARQRGVHVVETTEGIEESNQVDRLPTGTVLLNPGSQPRPYFESLKSIHLDNTPVDTFNSALVVALSARRSIGLPVKKLRLTGISQVPDDTLARVFYLVDDLQCEFDEPELDSEHPWDVQDVDWADEVLDDDGLEG